MDTNDKEWVAKLTPEQHRVLRGGDTEAPFSGKLLGEKRKGVYACIACGTELFKSDHKYESGSGWPSFYEVARSGAVKLQKDNSLGMNRIEVLCSHCGGHLGHVFNDGPADKTGKRYCINSVCLDFKAADKLE